MPLPLTLSCRSLTVDICSLTGDLVCQIIANTDWTVRDLKEAIESAVSFPKNRQRLLIGTTQLQDKDPLALAVERCLPTFSFPSTSASDVADDIITMTLIRLTELKVEWIRRVQQNGLELRNAPDSPRIDPTVTLAAVEQNGLALACAHRELQEDRHIVLAAVQQNGLALMYAATKLRADMEITSAAVKQNPAARSCAASCVQESLPLILDEGEVSLDASEVHSTSLTQAETMSSAKVHPGNESPSSVPGVGLTESRQLSSLKALSQNVTSEKDWSSRKKQTESSVHNKPLPQRRSFGSIAGSVRRAAGL